MGTICSIADLPVSTGNVLRDKQCVLLRSGLTYAVGRSAASDGLLTFAQLLPASHEAQHHSFCVCWQVAACQWLGSEAVQGTLLDKMPDAMRKDVEKAVAAAPDRPKPPRCTRKEAAKRAAKVWSKRS